MKKFSSGPLVLPILAALTFTSLNPVYAALPDGAVAPDFTTQASKGGKIFSFHLENALKHGPVVLYFYPAAFTRNCTIEAHDFAEATGDYARLGAQVIGISTDSIAKLQKFSVSECRSRFAVAADPEGTVSKDYDAITPHASSAQAERISYVIAPDGHILMSYTNNNPDEHVSRTLTALKKFSEQK